jgi:hypothetical protein
MSDQDAIPHYPHQPGRDACPHCNARTGGPLAADMREFKHSICISKKHGLGVVIKYKAPVYTCGNCHYEWTDMQKDLAEYRARLEFLEQQLVDKLRRELGYMKEEDA